MKITLCICLLITTAFSFGQDSEIENLINQVAIDVVPNSFAYYFLVPKSRIQPKIYDSLKNYQIRELKKTYTNLPLNLTYKSTNKTTNWKMYNLKNVQYPSNKYINPIAPPRTKTVTFVKYNIKKQEYDSLVKTKPPHTIIVKKKWLWRKNRIWKNKTFYEELITAWKKDLKEKLEEKIYFQFSKPIFTKDKKYAIISVFKNWRCKGHGFTALYRKENGKWNKLIEYNRLASETITTHTRCQDISISY